MKEVRKVLKNPDQYALCGMSFKWVMFDFSGQTPPYDLTPEIRIPTIAELDAQSPLERVDLVEGVDVGDGYDFVSSDEKTITIKDRQSGMTITYVPLPYL